MLAAMPAIGHAQSGQSAQSAQAQAAQLAQAGIDAGSILRETERLRVPDVPPLAPAAIPEPPAEPDPDAVTFTISRFELTGVTLIPEQDIQAVLADYLNREITFDDLDRALVKISDLYSKRGWFARPQLPAQDIIDGTVRINIIEGRLGEIQILDPEELAIAPELINRYMLARQTPGDFLNTDEVNRAIGNLNDLPGISAGVVLSASETPGASDLLIQAAPTTALSTTISADNSGSRSTGRARATANAVWANPRGIGDQISSSLMFTEGNRFANFAYDIPVGYDGWRVNSSLSLLSYKNVLDEFALLDSKGSARTFAVTGNYPWIRTNTRTVRLTTGANHARYENELSGEIDNKTVTTLTGGLSGDFSDAWGGGAFTLWSLNATWGEVSLDSKLRQRDSGDETRRGPQTEGRFATLSGNLARLQRLTPNTTLWVSLNGQLASKNLDSSQGISLGGPAGVRAYPVSEGSGDQAIIATVEIRHNFNDQLQGIAFYDHGQVRQHRFDYRPETTTEPNTYELKGLGVGMTYSLSSRAQLRATLATKVGSNPIRTSEGNDGDGTNDQTRLWLNLSVSL
ncbi:ShlB/FhaC/HecB family hemolysin secretion/activation protein [Ectothiorhodosinus mongolicus]|nr:ShlB/FhaC/HecB family hemolysin secretion/activation protein [Ectothiorhodosinus mongolicus]